MTTSSAPASAGRSSAPDPRRSAPSTGTQQAVRPSSAPIALTRAAELPAVDAPAAPPDMAGPRLPGPGQMPGPSGHTPSQVPPPGPTGSLPNQAAIQDRTNMCTAPQLRRFIKSRPYVPMHELRRRFAIDGGDDDVTGVPMDPGRIFVGLPTREGRLLGDLLRTGEIGYELSLDPCTPIVIGVYPMRPIPRP